MKVIEFYGASDDLIEVDGDAPGCDEYNVISDGPLIATFAVEADEGGCRVHAIYTTGGVWSFAVAQMEEDFPVPADWTISTANGGFPTRRSSRTRRAMPDALRDQTKRWVWFSNEIARTGIRGPFGPFEARDVVEAQTIAAARALKAGLTLDYFTDEDDE